MKYGSVDFFAQVNSYPSTAQPAGAGSTAADIISVTNCSAQIKRMYPNAKHLTLLINQNNLIGYPEIQKLRIRMRITLHDVDE